MRQGRRLCITACLVVLLLCPLVILFSCNGSQDMDSAKERERQRQSDEEVLLVGLLLTAPTSASRTARDAMRATWLNVDKKTRSVQQKSGSHAVQRIEEKVVVNGETGKPAEVDVGSDKTPGESEIETRVQIPSKTSALHEKDQGARCTEKCWGQYFTRERHTQRCTEMRSRKETEKELHTERHGKEHK